MRRTSFILAGIALGIVLFTVTCSKDSTSVDISETGQQIGDVMASIDEGGAGGTSISSLEGASRTFARLAPQDTLDQLWNAAFESEALAATCASTTFSSCSSGIRTRTLGGCTVGAASFSGTIALTWSQSSCSLTSNGDTVTRVPAFVVTGRRGATLTVSKTGTNGQVITRGSAANSLTFSNDGIRRVFTSTSNTTLFDFTTSTTSPLTVTGAGRTGRVIDGGTLRVTNNLTSGTCDFTPSSVTWVSTCNCPTSGTWSGSCSDGSTSTLSITGCGEATFTSGSSSESFSFDRCYSI